MPNNRPAAQSAPLRIAQITDTHLYADPEGLLLGLNTRRCLQAVIELALQAGAVDLVVASGDLAHDGTAEAYQQVRDCFSRMAAPVCCLPGNHDEAGALRDHLNHGGFYSHRSHRLGAWQLLFLDSTVAGSEGGHLAATELAELDAALQHGKRDAIEAEVGDLLFSVVNLCRHLKIDPERALRRCNDRFVGRFRHVEAQVDEAGGDWSAFDADALEAFWQQAKQSRSRKPT